METITVCASRRYDVKIGEGLLPALGTLTATVVQGRKAVVVSDENVRPLYADLAAKSLQNAGFSPLQWTIPAGENSKSAPFYWDLINFLAENRLTKADCLIALGGGVVGDLTGFAAATYLRGIAYVQVPTTLLAMVDASVGGKTAIDLPAGKNLVGAFHQPALVLCDLDLLKTLPSAVFFNGCAEIVKYALLFDEALFAHLETRGTNFDRERVIARCVALKADAVKKDEFDRGNRRLLNFGHTLGHAIEQCSRYTVSHGQAVAIGMCAITRAAVARGLCDPTTERRLSSLLTRFSLPTETAFPTAELAEAVLSDKKRFGDQIALVIPATVGCAHTLTLPISELNFWIKAGL